MNTQAQPEPAAAVQARPPMAMLAELTHRCPLSCPYCSNPLELAAKASELGAADWATIFAQAAEIGVLQVHLSGGEPASRRDLEEIVGAAHAVDLYTNLITSGVGLTERRLDALVDNGLEHIQLSLQGVDAEMADRIGGYRGGFARKMQVADWIARREIPLTLNAVMHKQNLDRLPDTIELAVELGARRLEVATVQFHGWATRNRAALMPTRAQAREASRIVAEARERLRGVLVIDYVTADHHAEYPKPCMGGWGSTGFNVTPDGRVMPCHAAHTIPGLVFEQAPGTHLGDIWRHSAAFNAFRGFDWMQEPCRSCDRKTRDFGGCRCQAMAFAGDARATDPVCIKSPLHARLQEAAEADAAAEGAELVYRTSPA
ncbi:pyrroloquinoline quinone biosynthesis protein PqqE [Limibaculum sp. M0105]|uniref:PqqA peptide cyclase n=1 Tax=Thermohalobaculum xanthum TaxID=2753746 RepID=A0A8J7M774_9RHOB|nr:pyrroloquinoline quinone biosynthesis protein PqqE [Thermohalobaculum xanthum]MBK0399866.1 pyrroloquinoline quinone biosynthesis protein PqqE [Thermohalobaculum xanthum]